MKRILSIFLILVFIFSSSGYSSAWSKSLPEAILTVNTEMQIEVNAKACVLMDANTGTVLMAKNENEKLYPASITKIMTLLLICEAIENGKLTKELVVTCSETAAEKGGSQIWLEPGETMTIDELLKATAIYSANDASCLLGECVAGSERAFCDMMNKKAAELGMNDTHFDNCTGLDDDTQNHMTTAHDIALMSRALLGHDIIKEYMTIWMDTLRNGETQLVNTNRLIRHYPGATGIKTGTTSKAGCCISASAERDALELIAVVMGSENSDDRFSGAKNLLDWGFANYEIYNPDPCGDYEKSIKVTHGTLEKVNVTHTDIREILINRGGGKDIVTEVELSEEITAPVEKGQKLGKVVFKIGNTAIGACDLIAEENVEKMTMKNALKRLFCSLGRGETDALPERIGSDASRPTIYFGLR